MSSKFSFSQLSAVLETYQITADEIYYHTKTDGTVDGGK